MRDVDQPARQTSILVVDDEPDLRTLYELSLLREGHRVDVAGSLDEAHRHLQSSVYDVLITDMRLTDGLGTSLLQHVRANQRPERVIVITAYGSAENAVESLKAGAFDYLTKPVDLKQFRHVVASAVQDALSTPATEHQPRTPPRTAAPTAVTTDGVAALQRLVGSSTTMQQIRDRILKVARSMAPVLISGESGTGKELVARALHANSHRRGGPLVPVNCSAIPENLLEAEFFGVRKGAYTGASQDRDGFFQAAQGGTLFLDEIGDLPLAMQSKLLRAIQERRIRPLGAPQEEMVDVRIVSATHKDLTTAVQQGQFRQDLYYRLNVIEIRVPPLRERREDLPALCANILQRIADESGVEPPRLSHEFMALITEQPFEGNIRELENLLHRAVALSEDGELHFDPPTRPMTLEQTTAPSPLTLNTTPPQLPNDLQRHLDEQERAILIQALRETGYNRTAAAARLGISLRQIRYRIARLNIETEAGTDHATSDP